MANDLPSEILYAIADYADGLDLLPLRRVCRRYDSIFSPLIIRSLRLTLQDKPDISTFYGRSWRVHRSSPIPDAFVKYIPSIQVVLKYTGPVRSKT
ncbi:hypothetical protein AX16_008971 [Volvariella volvacea WC 439]|nr:hypothetical protein AX16_008971 [Volvariella volvacea WC 439]